MDAIRDLLRELTRFSDVGLLLMRLLVGFLFVYSGLGKYRKLRKFAEENGLPVVVAFLAVSAEFLGGLSVGLGIVPQLGALAIMGVMTGSMYHHIVKWKSPYWAASGGWEYDLMWFTMCLVIAVTGGGSIGLWPIV
ncbi:MAG: DoxX family protein [Gemmatimonadales bacterium]|nr:DoxX family protein [Gemmatimonadales bacterium]